MSRPVISVEKLSKAYRIGAKEQVADTIIGAVGSCLRAPLRNFQRLRRLDTAAASVAGLRQKASVVPDEEDLIWALRDVSFDIHEGEVVGIIGRNGAGKSTLLKILSRITEPTSGRAVIRGRVSSLLEVGTGFHPELTGRENIYMNGTILGMTKREIDRKFDEIVDFSGIAKFLDTPIKRYSSGMQVRLAFAVAAHLEPEILIIDEVLAVGDAEFQRKCLGKMQDVAQRGRTVLFVSHNMAAIEALCSRGLCIELGRLDSDAPIDTVIQAYRSALQYACKDSSPTYESTNGGVIRRIELIGATGTASSFVEVGKSLSIRMHLSTSERLIDPRVRIAFENAVGNRLLMVQTPIHASFGPFTGRAAVECKIPEFPLAPGSYKVSVSIADVRETIEAISGACAFSVEDAELFDEGRGFSQGVCATRSEWRTTTYAG